MASITCPKCQAVAAEGATTCASCGNALGAPEATAYAAGSTPPPAASYAASSPPPPASHAAGAHAAKPQVKFDLASIGQTDRLVGGGTLILFISLFLPWFSVHLGILGTYTADGLTAHGYLYITLILAIAIIGFLVAEVLGLWKLPATSPLTRDQILLVATGINFILVLLGFLLKPGGSGVGWSWGAFVALVAAVVAAFPLGWPIIQARRSK
jgi:hypothetical protein